MSSTPAGASNAVPAPDVPERRRNAALRALVDEMLSQVRGAQREGEAWSPEERAAAEAALARIMSRVRSAAVSGDGEPDQSP
jgi:hypothetical protein